MNSYKVAQGGAPFRVKWPAALRINVPSGSVPHPTRRDRRRPHHGARGRLSATVAARRALTDPINWFGLICALVVTVAACVPHPVDTTQITIEPTQQQETP